MLGSACARGPAAPVGKLGLSLEDGRLSAAARSALLNDPELGVRAIAIAVQQGVVTLSGSVRSAREVERALELVRQVDGVKDARSELRIAP
jgi:osmotically-inducible protein OsmY